MRRSDRRWYIFLAALAALLCGVAQTTAQTTAQTRGSDEQSSTDGPAFEIDAINSALPALDDPPNLETPMACVENFVFAGRDDDWTSASRSLNFRLIDDVNETRAERMAQQFFFVLNQELWIDWEMLPDRPDGMIHGRALSSNDPLAGKPQRSIRLGSIDTEGREIPIRIERVTAPDSDPVWLFSAHTVENISALYAAHGPSWLDAQMPEWARERVWAEVAIWQWMALGLALIIAPLIGYLLGTVITNRVLKVLPDGTHSAMESIRWPVAATVAALIIWCVIEWALSLPSSIAMILDPLALIALVVAIAWGVMRITSLIIEHLGKDLLCARLEDGSEQQRRILTQVTVAQHVVVLAVALLGIGVVLIELDVFRTVGVALLTSAGAA